MGFLDQLKKLAQPTDDYDEEFDDFAPKSPERSAADSRGSSRALAEMDANSTRPSAKRGGGYFNPEGAATRGNNKVVNIHATTQLQVVLVNPERFENAAEIADHLREKRTVVLNLEKTGKDIARRLIDFLSGVAYAQDGKIKKVAVSTFIITPYNVDLLGDLIDELENNGLYF